MQNILQPQLRDSVNAWIETSDGAYEAVGATAEPLNSHLWSLEHSG